MLLLTFSQLFISYFLIPRNKNDHNTEFYLLNLRIPKENYISLTVDSKFEISTGIVLQGLSGPTYGFILYLIEAYYLK